MRSPVTFMISDPYFEGPELVEGGERGTGICGLVTERAVELGRMTDRLVDRETQVRRVDDQVVEAGLDRRGGDLRREELGDLAELGIGIPAAATF